MASSRLTHRGWQAETAALAVAECAAFAARAANPTEIVHILEILRAFSIEAEWSNVLSRMESSLVANDSVADFVRVLGLKSGVTGYAMHVVPVAIYAWLRHPADFRTALTSALNCG